MGCVTFSFLIEFSALRQQCINSGNVAFVLHSQHVPYFQQNYFHLGALVSLGNVEMIYVPYGSIDLSYCIIYLFRSCSVLVVPCCSTGT